MRDHVSFWTEGGRGVGMGHLVRSINVALVLERRGVRVGFMVNDDTSAAGRLDDAGLDYVTVPLDGPPYSIDRAGDVVVLDTKRDVGALVGELRDGGRRVALVENPTASEADRFIVPSPVARGFQDIAEERLSAGAEYIILGENILKARASTPKTEWSLPLKVLVTMGGADPFDLAGLVARGLLDLDGIEVTVVLGPACDTSERIKRLAAAGKGRMRTLTGVSDLAPLARTSHVAFTAVGTTVYELAYLGVPSILVANYEDDSEYLSAFEDLGISIALGYYGSLDPARIAAAVEEFKCARPMWETMSEKALGLTDGRGAERVAGMIEALYAGAVTRGVS